MLHSGIDLHKRTVVIATVDPDGRPVRDVQLPAKREAVTRSFAGLPGGPAAQRTVVESTSTWYWLRDLLVGQGVDLRLGHSKRGKAISYAKVKTDAGDAAVRLRAREAQAPRGRRRLRSTSTASAIPVPTPASIARRGIHPAWATSAHRSTSATTSAGPIVSAASRSSRRSSGLKPRPPPARTGGRDAIICCRARG